ncbi:hypothetical protein GKZ90_0019575 [Flavobacterium sp. MC2016-06]|jgi:hypothetical protein|uniref:hypothetical protein n=1 Tax=Flavobacterium sp. MC2016-06 TaxID=2676308 RepID=UPI0012BA9D7B|nr:hypothetical protein [Flavobacterium sp. MC2016-06]MBU3862137.1 hypothetical protein [Flavobacterium sp. MC2016-06]
MRKIFLFLAVIYNSVLFSQTILNTYPLNLNKNSKSNQILNAKNELTNEVFTFVVTDENFTILRYNSALFLTDQFNNSLEYVKNRTLLGYSFSEDGNPTLYWSSQYGESIMIIKYYFENKTSKALKFQFPNTSQTIRAEYQNDNSFIILAEDIAEPTLIFYVFKNGNVEQKGIDFSPFTFQDKKGQSKSLKQILRENPIEKMEAGEYNPLFKAASKTKMYTLKNRVILTFDNSLKKTQLFDIDLVTLEVKEKNFTQSISPKQPPTTSNSFYHESKLFQINANQNELLFTVKDFDSEQILKNITVSKNDTIHFKNSPLFLQKDNSKPKELKNTSKFLEHLWSSNIGLSVFKNKKNIFITAGGIKERVVYMADGGGFDELNNYYSESYEHSVSPESVFFESIWNKKLESTTQVQEPLGIDKVYLFMDAHKKIILESILKFKDYYILGYFDTAAKQYTMRKFTDGYN